MKTLKLLLLALVTCCGLYTNAQVVCGVNANYQVSLNPNNVPVFHDSSFYSNGWNNVSYAWDFGDGSTSTQQNPSHVFSGPGPFNVCLIVTAISQNTGAIITCSDTVCKPYTNCSGMVVATAQATPQSNGVIVYTGAGSSNYPPLTYSWTFPNGVPSTSTTAVTTVQYQQNGAYTGCFTVTDTNGCSATNCATATITNAPCTNIHASFTAQTTTGGVALQSTSTGVGSGTQYQWFMDGTAITNPNPNSSYNYVLPNGGGANHLFCLKVFASNATSVACDDTCKTVYVPGSGACGGSVATFTKTVSGNTLSVNAGTNYPTGTLFQWWLNGTATTVAPTLMQYNWTNLAAGTYQICLYTYNANQQFCDSACHTVTIAACNASAVFTTQTSTNGTTFVANGNPSGTLYYWSFGDGTNGTTTAPQTIHQYPVSSSTVTYMACLKVSIPGTNCVDSTCVPVVVPGTGSGCQANFSISYPTTTNNPQFVNQSSTSGVTFTSVWDFGDGSSSTLTSPSHTYNVPGTYQVCLTITTANGCTSTTCSNLTVSNNCQLAVTITKSGNTLTANATGGAGGYAYAWTTGEITQSITPTSAGTYCVTVSDANGQCMGYGCHTVTPTYTDTVCGIAFIDLNGNGVLDNNENGIPNALIYVGNFTTYTDSNGHYSITVPAGVYLIKYCAGANYTYTIPLSAGSNTLNNCGYYYQQVITGGGTHCGYNFGIQNNSVTICGKVFFDANNNGVQDANTEGGISGAHVYITSGNGTVYHAYTNSLGEYCKTLPAGTYTITVTSNSTVSCATTPTSIQLTTTAGQNYPNKNFAVYCQPGICNLKINITPNTTVTTGFPAWYQMQVTNVGTSVSSGIANFFYDAALVFDYANPVQSSHNASTRTVSFNINNLLPGQSKYYMVRFNALTTLTIGQFVFTLANINPDVNCNDVNLTNNVDTIHQAVTASWDPNNKLAYTTNYDPNPAFQLVSSLEPNQRIEYVINFQNTGTSPAVNVVVEDLITADLDFSTFEFLGASHPCLVTSDASKVNFKFSGIMLPDSTNDEPNSHGFIRFAINAVNGLQGGHVISDDAAIYFDYNAPVITNDAAVTLLEPNGIDEVTATTVVIAPNPMNEYAQVTLKGNTNGFTFRVTDITGRVVSEQVTDNENLIFNRSNLSAGIYVYSVVQSNKPVAKGKLIIE
jgi:uncharacterized repeat protein (TIGR01451 family)